MRKDLLNLNWVSIVLDSWGFAWSSPVTAFLRRVHGRGRISNNHLQCPPDTPVTGI